MNVNVSSSTDYSSSDYEAQANRLRAEMGVTIDELRCSLTPSKLASEAAARAGIAELSWSGAFDFASKRHPNSHRDHWIGYRIVDVIGSSRSSKEQSLCKPSFAFDGRRSRCRAVRRTRRLRPTTSTDRSSSRTSNSETRRRLMRREWRRRTVGPIRNSRSLSEFST